MPPDTNSTPSVPLQDGAQHTGSVPTQPSPVANRRPLPPSRAAQDEKRIGEWASGTVALLVVMLVGFAWFGPSNRRIAAVNAADRVPPHQWQPELGATVERVHAEVTQFARDAGISTQVEVRTNPKSGEIFVRGYQAPVKHWYLAARPRHGGWEYFYKRWNQAP